MDKTHWPSIKKIKGLMCSLRIVRDKFTEQQTRTLVTAQVFSILYYASPVWLTPHLMAPKLRKVESIPYRSLSLTLGVYWLDLALVVLPCWLTVGYCPLLFLHHWMFYGSFFPIKVLTAFLLLECPAKLIVPDTFIYWLVIIFFAFCGSPESKVARCAGVRTPDPQIPSQMPWQLGHSDLFYFWFVIFFAGKWSTFTDENINNILVNFITHPFNLKKPSSVQWNNCEWQQRSKGKVQYLLPQNQSL